MYIFINFRCPPSFKCVIFSASLTLTVVIPRIPNLRLDLADIHARIDDGAPEYKLGPGAYTSKGKVLITPDYVSAFPFATRQDNHCRSKLFKRSIL